MASKLETRIATMRYHGLNHHQWWRLTDEEQEALIREAGEENNITYMCAHGKHGTSERRYSTFSDTGVPKFDGMYTGTCAGSYVRLLNGKYEQGNCPCECHNA